MLFNCVRNCDTCNNQICKNGKHDNDVAANRVTSTYHTSNRLELKSKPSYKVYTAFNGTRTSVMRFDAKRK